MDDERTVGQILRAKRTERLLTQTAVANAANCETYWVSLIETGKRIPTKGNKLRLMCEFLDLDYPTILKKAKAEKAKQ